MRFPSQGFCRGDVVQFPERLLELFYRGLEPFLIAPGILVNGLQKFDRIAQLLGLDAQRVPLVFIHSRELPAGASDGLPKSVEPAIREAFDRPLGKLSAPPRADGTPSNDVDQ